LAHHEEQVERQELQEEEQVEMQELQEEEQVEIQELQEGVLISELRDHAEEQEKNRSRERNFEQHLEPEQQLVMLEQEVETERQRLAAHVSQSPRHSLDGDPRASDTNGNFR
jgi:hypothetical protein